MIKTVTDDFPLTHAEFEATDNTRTYAAPFDWANLDALVDRYCAALAEDVAERTSMFEVAINTKAPQICTIAVLAEKRLGTEGFAERISTFQNFSLERLKSVQDKLTHNDWLKGYLAVGGDPNAVEVRSEVDHMIQLETTGGDFDATRTTILFNAGLVTAPLAISIYNLARANSHDGLARQALTVLAHADTTDERDQLARHLEARADESLRSDDLLLSAQLLVDLKSLGPLSDSAVVVFTRTLRSLNMRTRAGKTDHLADLRFLDPQQPDAIFDAVRKSVALGNREAGARHLKDLCETNFKLALIEGRKAIADGEETLGLLFYDWLATNQRFIPEVNKVRSRIARARRILLSECNSSVPEDQLHAAELHLEVEPENTRSLWIRSRMLGKLKRFKEAREALEQLLAIDTEYPGAVSYKASLDKRLA